MIVTNMNRLKGHLHFVGQHFDIECEVDLATNRMGISRQRYNSRMTYNGRSGYLQCLLLLVRLRYWWRSTLGDWGVFLLTASMGRSKNWPILFHLRPGGLRIWGLSLDLSTSCSSSTRGKGAMPVPCEIWPHLSSIDIMRRLSFAIDKEFKGSRRALPNKMYDSLDIYNTCCLERVKL
jgi:hypothetical protein